MESGGDAIDALGAADVPAVPAVRFSTEPNRRDPEIVRSFMRRLVVVFTAAAVALLLSIAWEVTRTAPDVDLSTGPGLWFLMGLAWIGAFAASLWFVPPAWSGLCLAAVAGALATLSGAVAESVDSTERPYLWGLEGSSVALRFATSCAFVLLLVWAAWSMVPSVHRRSPVWLQVVAGVGALVLLVVAWRLVPDAGVAFD